MSTVPQTTSPDPNQAPNTGAQQTGSAPSGQDPAQNTAAPTTPSPKTTFSDEEVKELISKARSDEKSKVYGKLDEIKAQKAEAEKKLQELGAELKSTRGDLDAVRSGKQTEVDSILKEMQGIREMNAKLELAIESVATTSAAKIREAEVKAYREKRIREESVQLHELVVGVDEASIDAAIEAAKKRETEITARVRDEVAKQLAGQLPTPIAPDGSQGRNSGSGIASAKNREAMASLKGDDYSKHRLKLLEDAKTKVGIRG